jgi:hypothetical protein
MGKMLGLVQRVLTTDYAYNTDGKTHLAALQMPCLEGVFFDMLTDRMQSPQTPATLTPEQVNELNQKLSHMRHEINNQLSLVVAALELIRFKPDTRDKMLNTISEQPNKIIAELQKFSTEFEKTFGITRD